MVERNTAITAVSYWIQRHFLQRPLVNSQKAILAYYQCWRRRWWWWQYD